MRKLLDKNGLEVKVGDFVKVLSLNVRDFGHLEEKELSEVMSMIGDVLKIYEIDEYGQAWVEKEWWLAEDDYMSHSVGLSANEMELQSAGS